MKTEIVNKWWDSLSHEQKEDYIKRMNPFNWGKPNPNNDFYGLNPKVNSDNTINIKPIKDSWSREEVVHFLNQYRLFGHSDLPGFNKWVEENL